jgi:hypothetical protein
MPAYAPARGVDPLFDAYLARYSQGRAGATRSAGQRKTAALTARDQALREIESAGAAGREQINTAMLQRGMFRAGETTERQAQFAADLANRRRSAESGYSTQIGGINAWLANELARLEAERTGQAAESQKRVYDRNLRNYFLALASQTPQPAPAARADTGGSGGGVRRSSGGGGGGYRAPARAPAPRPAAPVAPRPAPAPVFNKPTRYNPATAPGYRRRGSTSRYF